MTEMEERVARASFACWKMENSRVANFEDINPDELAFAERHARAIIRAMREPTEAQYDALCATNKVWRELNSYIVWQTYIDAASGRNTP